MEALYLRAEARPHRWGASSPVATSTDHALRPEVRDPPTGHQAAGHQVAGRGRAAFLLAVRLEEERHAGQEAAAAAMLAADVTDAAALDHA